MAAYQSLFMLVAGFTLVALASKRSDSFSPFKLKANALVNPIEAR